MNAFLIFCKRHRSLVREKYPHLENRSVTKILGELWANLESDEKATYTQLAKQYKEAFMKANPDFKWYKLPSPPSRPPITRPSNHRIPILELGATEPSSALPPCGITPGKLADETQMGGLSSLITPSTPSSPKTISKPPKKRYLENGAFRSQPPEETAIINPPTSSSSSSPLTCDSQANNCSALLKLAEVRMCSIELVRDGPGASNKQAINGRVASITNSSTTACAVPSTSLAASPPPATSPSVVISMTSTTTVASTAITNTDPSTTSVFSPAGISKMMQKMAEYSGRNAPGINPCVHPFASTLPDRNSAGQGAVGNVEPKKEEEPLDLCKEKTITASHQDLIDRIVDKMWDDNHYIRNNSGKGALGSASKLPKSIQNVNEADDGDYARGSSEGDVRDEREAKQDLDGGLISSGSSNIVEKKGAITPFKKVKGVRHIEGASHKFGESSNPLDTGAYAKKEDSCSPRKSQRSCKGKRYEAFMSEGMLQPPKERKLSNSRKPSSSGGGDVDLPPNSTSGSPSIQSRTPSESSESATSRKSDKDDATKISKISRCSTPSDDEVDAFGGISANDAFLAKQKGIADMSTESDRLRKRFKTGDFDLEEHIAALPKCSLDALDRKKQRRQVSSSNSNRKSFRDDKRNYDIEESNVDAMCLSEDSSEKADSSSSESRGEKPVLVGSQKRKARKRSITHLDPAAGTLKPNTSVVEAGVLGNLKLVALAEVATSEKRMPSGSSQTDSDSPTGSA